MATERTTVDLSDESIRKLAFEMGKAFMLPPKEHEADNERAGKAIVEVLRFNSAANTWHPRILVAPAGDTRIQVFDSTIWSVAGQASYPFLCFFKNTPPGAVADGAGITVASKPSDSAALAPFGLREILRGATLLATTTTFTPPAPTQFKGQSGLSNPGEGLALVIGSEAVNFGADHFANVTYRSIIDVR